MLPIHVDHQAGLDARFPLESLPAMHEEQSGLHAEEVIARGVFEVLPSAVVRVDAGECELFREIDVSRAPEPVEVPIAVVAAEAKEGVELDVLDLALVAVAERGVEAVNECR